MLRWRLSSPKLSVNRSHSWAHRKPRCETPAWIPFDRARNVSRGRSRVKCSFEPSKPKPPRMGKLKRTREGERTILWCGLFASFLSAIVTRFFGRGLRFHHRTCEFSDRPKVQAERFNPPSKR